MILTLPKSIRDVMPVVAARSAPDSRFLLSLGYRFSKPESSNEKSVENYVCTSEYALICLGAP